MPGGETVAAVAFYLGVGALVVGAMLSARQAIELRPGRSTPGLALVGIGAAGIAIAVFVFARGPRGVLPF
ncbi:MAG: hypothetical protein NVS2B3_13440 [Vulcanimicrobiaceae bacterium]